MTDTFWWAIVAMCVALLAGETYSRHAGLSFKSQMLALRTIWFVGIFALLIQLFTRLYA